MGNDNIEFLSGTKANDVPHGVDTSPDKPMGDGKGQAKFTDPKNEKNAGSGGSRPDHQMKWPNAVGSERSNSSSAAAGRSFIVSPGDCTGPAINYDTSKG
jgi:hypothetical protein